MTVTTITGNSIVIVAAQRTPMGHFQGLLGDVPATALGSQAVKALLTDVAGNQIDELFMGCVLPAGLGQAPARQAALGAGIDQKTPCTTINKMCGSAMQAVILAHDRLKQGEGNIMVAGGMENMSRAPYLSDKARQGYRMGHGRLLDHMLFDGLEDAYQPGKLMGAFAEDIVDHYQLTREAQDRFAITSLERARDAVENNLFANELTPVTVTNRKGATLVDQDETPLKARPEKIPQLKPAFRKDGTITAGNASAISDGAAALLLMSLAEAEHRGLTPLAVIRGHAVHAQQPALFTTAPVFSIRKLLEKLSWSADQVDLYEINEAFACVTMIAMQELAIPHDKVNIHGGACALGHPIGASGARILATLLHALQHYDLKRGIAGLCIGGGDATAVAVERI